MIHAAAGVTHLAPQTPNDAVLQTVTGEWEIRGWNFAQMKALYLHFRMDFDDVDWGARIGLND